ncbi:hypothetical protein L6232_24490, partial [Shewanella sp. C31]|nr:hypothetical protein [Shewanella electrica]
VTLVDPLHLEEYLGAFPEARAQVVYADLLLLDKADRAEAEELERAEARLRALNPLAPLHRTVRGEGVPVADLLFHRRAQGFRIFPPAP